MTLLAGVAIRDQSEPFERLYSEADEALYLAKRSGRNWMELSARAKEALPSVKSADHQNLA
jgi:PleD family two-component response regulator